MLSYLLEVSLCLAIFYGVYYALLRNDTFFGRNRFYLLITVTLAWLIPLWEFKYFVIQAETAQPYTLPALSVGIYELENELVDWQSSFSYWWSIYLIITTLVLLHFSWQMGRLAWFIRHSERHYRRGYLLIHTEGKLPTFSFLNYLFWDNSKDLTEEEADKILSHELKHIWARHSYDVLYLEFLKIWFWFNPFIYWYSQALKFQHEYIADATVLRETDAKSYSSLLVKTLFKNMNLPLAHGFNKSEISQRIKVMQKRRSPWRAYWKALLVLPLVGMLVFAFSGRIEESPKINLVDNDNEMNRFVDVEGGLDNFYQKLRKVLVYPPELIDKGIEGRVFIQFTVNQDGSTSDFKVSQSLHPILDEAALSAVKNIKLRWLPAKVDGNPVRQQISLPIFF
ncbi:MAG: M56 family metallopeptidase [Microscillaceae bacterium]|jgi:TonB family protein|nr:M56 family metallopeptidase [Microscillaceae bacterium]